MSLLINSYRFGVTAFSPLDVSPVLWLDASDAATITASSGFVDEWRDKSASGTFDVSAASGFRPQTGAATLNSLNVISFAGADDRLNYSGTTGVDISDLTVFVVAGETSGATANVGFFTMHDTTGDDYASDNAILLESADSLTYAKVFRKLADGGGASIAGSGAAPTSIWVIRATDTSLKLYQNGGTASSVTQSSPKGTAAGGYLIGNRYLSGAISNTNGLNGPVAEVIVCASTLSVADTNLAGNYLGTKWGLSWSDISS